jgi:hypothetical protein
MNTAKPITRAAGGQRADSGAPHEHCKQSTLAVHAPLYDLHAEISSSCN